MVFLHVVSLLLDVAEEMTGVSLEVLKVILVAESLLCSYDVDVITCLCLSKDTSNLYRILQKTLKCHPSIKKTSLEIDRILAPLATLLKFGNSFEGGGRGLDNLEAVIKHIVLIVVWLRVCLV